MKTIIVTPFYNDWRIVEASMRTLWASTLGVDYQLAILDAHWPLDEYDQLKELVHRIRRDGPNDWGFLRMPLLIDPGKNLGLHGNWNYAFRELERTQGLEDDDVVGLFDPDEFMVSDKWLQAVKTVMAADPKLGWVTMSSKFNREDCQRVGYDPVMICDEIVWRPRAPVICHVSFFRVGAIRKLGGMTEGRPYYGYLESDMIPKLSNAGYWFGCLVGHEGHIMLGHRQHPRYKEYKLAHVSGSDAFLGSFEEYLQTHPA